MTAAPQSFERFEITLVLPNEWRNTELIRVAVGLCVQAVFSSREHCEAIGMVSAELVENAFKYSTQSIVFGLHRAADAIVIDVASRGVSADHLAGLRSRLSWIAGFDTPMAAYLARMQEIAAQSEPSGGLGLVRIAYEGGCTLSCRQAEDGWLHVLATHALDTRLT